MTNDNFAELSIVSPTASMNDTPIPADEGADAAQASGEAEAAPQDASRRKVRHNLTERRRVDRMNQLFNRLYAAIEETAPPSNTIDKATGQPVLSILGADGKPINPNRWSKADVLEGALNVINELKSQLSAERLARTLGMPTGPNDNADALSTSYEHSTAGSDSYADSDQFSEPSGVAEPHMAMMPAASQVPLDFIGMDGPE